MGEFVFPELAPFLPGDEYEMALRKTPPPPGLNPGGDPPWDDRDFACDYPSVHAFLKDTSWEDKTVRLTGTLSIFVQQGALKIAVNDRHRQLVAFVTAPSWAEAFTLLDVGICNDSLDWKAARVTPGTKTPPF